MSSFRHPKNERTNLRRLPFLALAAVTFLLTAHHANGQSTTSQSPLRPGQSMYIVAFRQYQYPLIIDQSEPGPSQRDYLNYDLDAERKVRKRIELWTSLKVAEKLSQADFVFLVHLDESSMEGLAIPLDSYQQHFKDKFDLDALREAAFGRYLIGPLKLPTISRLSDRLVKQMLEKLPIVNRKS